MLEKKSCVWERVETARNYGTLYICPQGPRPPPPTLGEEPEYSICPLSVAAALSTSCLPIVALKQDSSTPKPSSLWQRGEKKDKLLVDVSYNSPLKLARSLVGKKHQGPSSILYLLTEAQGCSWGGGDGGNLPPPTPKIREASYVPEPPRCLLFWWQCTTF